MIRGRWIWDKHLQKLVPSHEFYARRYGELAASDLPAPMVMKDIEPYRSVIDGSTIGGRRQHRDHLKAHGCIEVGNEMGTSRGPARPPKHEVMADIKRAMDDGNLRSEAMAASKRAKRALA